MGRVLFEKNADTQMPMASTTKIMTCILTLESTKLDDTVTFSARGKKPGEPRRQITLKHTEFIRRYLMHVLPPGFQNIRYYGFLNNRYKTRNLKLIFTLQGHQRFKAKYTNLSMAELLKAVWNLNIHICPECGCSNMRHIGRTYGSS